MISFTALNEKKEDMTTEDINQITAAVIAQLRQGATDLDGIKASSALADTDNVIAANGSTVKKLPVSLFKNIVASYRLMVSGQTFKADTTAVLVGVTKSEGGKIEQLTALPKGWRIKVEWKGSASAMSNVLSAPGTINPNAAAGSTSVEITLYDGDPTTDQTAQAIDEATLLLVSDGKDGKDGTPKVLYDECFYPNKAATTDTDNYTDSTEILQPTGYVGDYTDADGKQWTDVFSCESFPDWFDAAQRICYPYNNGLSVGIPFIKHTWTVTDGKLVFNFNNNMVDATVPYFYVISMSGLKKIDDTHFTVYDGKGSTLVWNNFDKTKIDCAKFAFGNATLNTLYDVTGCKRIRVRVMGGVSTPSRYASLVPDISPFAMRHYISSQTLYADSYAEYELGESSYSMTRLGSSSFYRTSYTQSPQLLSGEFTVNMGTSVYKTQKGVFKLYKTGGKTYFCLNSFYDPAVQITMGSRIIIEKLE